MRDRKISLSRNQFLLVIFLAAAAGGIASFVHQVAAKESSVLDEYKDLKVFTDVLGLVERNYVQQVEVNQLVEGAVKGMLQNLDPHSSFMNQDAYKELQVETKGEFGGLGIEITVKDGLLTVVSPIEDSPAARAGVQAGDQIIKIGDRFSKDLTLLDAVKMMRGPKGSPITLYMHREGSAELVPLTVVRDIIHVQSVRSRMLEDGFGYVRLAQFQEGSASEFKEALNQLPKQSTDQKLHGLVLDLRNNPGGLLTQAIKVADLFLDDGLIVYTDGRLESQKQKYYATKDGSEPSYPIVIIVNSGSASASEIVAGAMQDSKRALVLGVQSFGKGSVQTILPMESGAALRLTTALYYTRNGRSIQAEGIKPDVVVANRRLPSDSEELLEEDEAENPATMKEKDLPGAIKNPKKGKSSSSDNDADTNVKSQPSKGTSKKSSKGQSKAEQDRIPIGSRQAMEADIAKLLKDDVQLEEALKMLKTLHIFQQRPQANQSMAQAISKPVAPKALQ